MNQPRFRVHVWGFRDGLRIVERRDFITEKGARRFAAITRPPPGYATITTIDDDGGIGSTFAEYRNGIDTRNPSIQHDEEHDDMTAKQDTGTNPDAKPKKSTGKQSTEARAAAMKRSKKAIDVRTALAMPDADLRLVPVDERPALPDGIKMPKDPSGYADAYLRFITGLLKWEPLAWDHGKLPRDEAKALRVKVRAAIGKAAGVKPENVDGYKVRVHAEPGSKEKPAAKPRAKRAATSKPIPKAS
jgi:hypothetical protein